MGVKIEKISVEGVGPITSAELPLGPFNLIYGHNERGKTFLVEFVTRSLFKNLSGWSLRSAGGRGTVEVSGLVDQPQPLILTPSSTEKLEDLLEQEEAGLPSRISRLMVVKGADLSFDDENKNGIDNSILKDLLSGEGVLEDIQGKIKPTIRGASIKNRDIDGSRRGDISTRHTLHDSLRTLDGLFERIESVYSGGERRALTQRAEELKKEIALQDEARQHRAYLVNDKTRDLNRQLERIPQNKLNELETDYKALERVDRRIARFDKEVAEFERESEHYEWLNQAIDWYERRGIENSTKPNRAYLIVSGIAVLLAILFSILNIPALTIGMILVATVCGLLYWRELEKSAALALDAEEMKKLASEFESRFDQPLSGLPQMRELKEVMDEAHVSAKNRRRDLDGEYAEREELAEKFASLLRQLTGEAVDQENWPTAIRDLNDQHRLLQDQLAAVAAELPVLQVSEDDYRSEPAAVEYNQASLEEYNNALGEASAKLNRVNEQLDNLKQNTCAFTGDDYSTSWEKVIANLQKKRERISEDYRQITAKILAGILVNTALEEIRSREKEMIRRRLSSSEVGEAIYGITGRYTGAVYEEGQVWAEDKYGKFKISDLSTGAREQVLLGLRLGFASQIFKQRQLFLLLDDAFQHADWSRRKRLVNQSVALAEDEWQIIYFTMDDNIRDLFDEAGHKHFPDSYRHHDLNVSSATITQGE